MLRNLFFVLFATGLLFSCQRDQEDGFDQREIYLGSYPVKVRVIYEKFSDTDAGELRVAKGANPNELALTLVTDTEQTFSATLSENNAFLVPESFIVNDGTRIQFSGEGEFLSNSVNMTLDALMLDYNTRQRIAVTGI